MSEEAVEKEVLRWVSKWALSDQCVECHLGKISGNNFLVDIGNYTRFVGKNNHHDTLGEALAKARQMRDKKITSLRAQIKKLEGMFV